jgi:hypothetical protein
MAAVTGTASSSSSSSPSGGGGGGSPAAGAMGHHHRRTAAYLAARHEGARLLGLAGNHMLLRFAQLQAAASQIAANHSGGGPATWRPLHALLAAWRKRLASKAAGQEACRGRRGGRHWIDKGMAAERALDLPAAAAAYEEALALDPANPEILAQLAKQLSDMSYAPGVSQATIERVNGRAIQLADAAVAAAPTNAWGHIAGCVAKGRMALFTADTRLKARARLGLPCLACPCSRAAAAR